MGRLFSSKLFSPLVEGVLCIVAWHLSLEVVHQHVGRWLPSEVLLLLREVLLLLREMLLVTQRSQRRVCSDLQALSQPRVQGNVHIA